MLNGYYIIQQYANVIQDYPLFFTFAKKNKLWKYIYPHYRWDVLQIIALVCLSPGTLNEKYNFLQRELYYFYNKIVCTFHLKKKNKCKQKRSIPKHKNHCDICGKDKLEYMTKSLFPGKKVCNYCYMQHKRKYVNKYYGRLIKTCELCGKETRTGLYTSVFPGKKVCMSCYQKEMYRRKKKK